jgi:hypothetical protein
MSASKAEGCSCGFFERAKAKPEGKVVFEARTNEYFSVDVEKGADGTKKMTATIISNCPVCGGAAPPSKRDALFEEIEPSERDRVRRLLSGLRTFEDAAQRLGPPDAVGRRTVSGPGRAPKEHKTVTYRGLSQTLVVTLADDGPNGVLTLTLAGKLRT